MAKPRTAQEKLKPSFEHNMDKVKSRVPREGEVWSNRKGVLFVVKAVANLRPVDSESCCFPTTVLYVRQDLPDNLGARHLIAWSSVMTFISSGDSL